MDAGWDAWGISRMQYWFDKWFDAGPLGKLLAGGALDDWIGPAEVAAFQAFADGTQMPHLQQVPALRPI